MGQKTFSGSLLSFAGSSVVDSRPLVSIVVATLNTPRLTQACLESVVKNSSVPYELIVVNNSRARAIRCCLKKFPRLRVIQNSKNLGYTKAANQGTLESRGEFLCFLNSDALVPPQWLERFLKTARQPGVGAVGPIIKGREHLYIRAPRGLPRSEATASFVDAAYQRWYSNEAKNVQRLTGFCILLPRAVIYRTGLFDERFFFGLEDDDFSLRLRLAGYKLLGLESVFVYHQGGGSIHIQKRRRLVQESKRRFLNKWRKFMGKKFLNVKAVHTAVDRKLRRISAPSLPTSAVLRSVQRPMRAGLTVHALNNHGSMALTRLSDFEMFSPDPLGWKIWNLLDGSISMEKIVHCLSRHSSKTRKVLSDEVRSRIETFVTHGLALWMRPSKSRQPLVSVMMAAHNADRWIAEAIESVLAQTFHNFELVIIDDASTDRTFQIASRYAWHPQLRLIQNPRQLGIAATRNRILALARGKYVAVCDADDVMRSTLLKRFTGFMETHSEVGWVYSDRLRIDAGGRPIGISQALPVNGHRELRHNIVFHGGALIRRRLMLQAGGYDESLCTVEDYDLALKIAERARLFALPDETHYLWRRYAESTSQRNPWAKKDTRRAVANALLRRKKIR